jgi:DtxR family Mn-dependent transcriptional regulator
LVWGHWTLQRGRGVEWADGGAAGGYTLPAGAGSYIEERSIASESVENYLKAMYELEEEDPGRVATTALAERLRVASPSVTAMLKRLCQQEPPLVDYASHRGVTLTGAGRTRALRVIRHHRLIETFLYEVLEYTWDEVHEEAERLEHYISERFEERIARYLGDPEFDPHGSPIPSREGVVPQNSAVPLTRLAEGRAARVVRVVHPQQAVREYLQGLGVVVDATVCVVERAPFDGPVYVRVGEGAHAKVHGIGVRVAEKVQVEEEKK